MRAIAQRLADKLQQMASGSSQPDVPIHIDPPTPDKPDNPKPQPPAVKLIDALKLDRLSDAFGIGDNVRNNANRTADKINELYQNLAQITGTDKQSYQVELSSPGDELTRPLRNYVLLSFSNLERAINDLVTVCNDRWIRDPQTGLKCDTLKLLRVDLLAIDSHYQDTVNYNYYLIENKLNTLVGYLNFNLKGE